jgi:hypothetical protein
MSALVTDFDQFYKKYPRKVAKADARKAWAKTAAIRPAIDVLLAAIERAIAWREQLAKRRDFVPAWPYPATWLNGERWSDEFDAPVALAAAEDATAARAWDEACAAVVRDALPEGGFSDSRTPAVSRQFWSRMRDMKPSDVRFIRAEYMQAFSVAPQRNVVQITAKRRAA